MSADKFTIVAIDDDEESLSFFRSAMEKSFPGCRFLCSLEPEESLDIVRRELPEAVFLDVRMPGRDGFAVCRAMKADPALADIPVIFITAFEISNEVRLQALAAGGEGFLSKPFSEAEMTAQVRLMRKLREGALALRREKEHLRGQLDERTRELLRESEERRLTEKARRELEGRYSELFEKMEEGFALHEIICDKDGKPADYRFVDLNPAFERLTGLKRGDLLGRTVLEVMPGTEMRWIDSYGEVALTGKPLKIEDFSGVLDRHYSVTAFSPSHGRFAVIFSDITDRKRSEQALLESDALNRGVLETALDGFLLAGPDGSILQANKAYCEMSGYSAQELRRMKVRDLEAGEAPGRAAGHIARVREAGGGCFESRHRRKDGSILCVEVSVSPLPHREGVTVSFLRDITERKNLESAEERSRARYAAIFGQSPMAIEYCDEVGRLAGVNEAFIEMFGVRDISQLAGSRLSVGGGLPPESAEKLARGETVHAETEFDFSKAPFSTSRSGRIILDYHVAPLLERGRTAGYVAQMQDITARKEAESAAARRGELLSLINRSGELHKLLRGALDLLRGWSGCEAAGVRLRDGDDYPYFETSGFPAGFVLAEGRLCPAGGGGRAEREISGSAVLECMCGTVVRGRFDPTLPFFTENGSFWTNSTSELLASSLKKKSRGRTRDRCHAEGYESVALVPMRSGVEVVGLLQLNSKRKGAFEPGFISFLEYSAGQLAIAVSHLKAQEALRRNEVRLTEAQSAAKVGNWELNLRTHSVWASAEARKIYGFSPDEPLTWEMVKAPLPQAYRKDLDIAMERVAAGEGSYDIEYEIRQVNTGRTVWVRSKATLVMSKEGDALVSGVMQDITELKRLEAARFEFSDMLTKSLNEIYVFDAGTLRFQYANRGALRNLGYSQEELRGMTPVDIMPEFTEERLKSIIVPLVSREKDELVFETVHRRKDGSVYPVEIHLQFSDYEGRRRFLAVVNDITERRLAERELKANLEEKEVLLREIHHRVKNNLQVITSLLNLQSRKVRGKEAQNVFRESRARVHAMALVHEILYRSGNFSSLNMQEYFGKLARSVHASYRGGTEVRLVLDVCDRTISVDTAVSLGLILSELLSNAMKHAFPGRARGEVRIILAGVGDRFSLEVSDDGAGLPGGFDPAAAETLGMQLVATLTRQIGGELEVKSGAGACFKISFHGQPRGAA